LELASRLKPFEHWLWGRLTGKVLDVGDGSRLVAKGLNARRRGNLIARKFKAIEECVCVEIDGAAFEAHVGPYQLKHEHAFYARAFPGDKRLAYLLSKQLKLKGVLSCNAFFERPGARASGDFNTGMGNSLIFLVEIVAALRGLGIHFDVLVDGDNVLVFVSKQHLGRLLSDLPVAVRASSGHECTVERPAHRLEDVRFGGCAPVWTPDGWTMVREWNRVVSTAVSSHIHLRHWNFARPWVSGVLQCELSMAQGIPILQSWARRSLDVLGEKRARDDFYADYRAVGASFEVKTRPVAMGTRLSFERAFGVSVERQLALEQTLVVRLSTDYRVEDPVTFADWDNVPIHSCT